MKNKTCRYLTYIFFLFSFSFVTAQELDYEWTHKGPNFSNDLENQVAYINLGDNQIWGWFEITITAGFSHRLAVGKYTKRFSIGKNKGEAGYFYQDSEVPEAFDRVAEQWKIGDLEKDVNGDLRIPIYHIDNKANGLFIKIKGNSPVTVNTDLFSVSDPVTLANEQTRDYVHFKDSRLGIGTTTPSVGLHVKRNSGFIVESEDGWKGSMKMVDGFSNTAARDDMLFSTPGGFMFKMDENRNGISNVQGFNVYNRNNESVFVIKESNNNVGVGTTAPDMKLSVQSDLKFITRFHSTSDDVMTGVRIGRSVSYADIVNLNDGLGIAPGSTSGNLALNTQNTSDVSIFAHNTSKNVGIGTVTPGDWKLAVNGKIRAKEIKVETGWSDFVFEEDYRLPTLEEVETYIKERGHLQDIPSAAEVEENGIFLGEMDAKLLQKIEELTLYTIQQEKEIERLKLLEKRLVEIEELLKVKK